MPVAPLPVNVELSLALVPALDRTGNPEFRHSLAVKASNPGAYPVKLGEVGIGLPNGAAVGIIGDPPSVKLPYLLPEGKHCSTFISIREFLSATQKMSLVGVIEIHGYYRNLSGHTYISPSMNFDIEKWKDTPLD